MLTIGLKRSSSWTRNFRLKEGRALSFKKMRENRTTCTVHSPCSCELVFFWSHIHNLWNCFQFKLFNSMHNDTLIVIFIRIWEDRYFIKKYVPVDMAEMWISLWTDVVFFVLVHFCWSLKNLLVLIYCKLHSKSYDYLYWWK